MPGSRFLIRDSRRQGQVLLLVTLTLIPMLGLLGLAVDIGYMQYVRRSAQTAADAAAWAAVLHYHSTVPGGSCGTSGELCVSTPQSCPSDLTTPANSLQIGCVYAKQHGFVSSGNQKVTYEAGTSASPPTVPGMSTASYWATFRVVQSVPQLFSAIVGHPTGIVAARATAAIAPRNTCIYTLDPAASGALSIGGSASLVSSCGIYVDSNSPSALSTNGGAILSAPDYSVVGGVSTSSPLTPAPNTGVAPVSDPLAYLPEPASPTYTCDHVNYSAPNWSNPTLSPGVYCGGINVGNNTYTFSPGVYILVGGGLTTQSANSHIQGAGVMFYNTLGAASNGTNYTYSPISINANSTVSLAAPTSGMYAGILFFEDRTAPTSYDSYGGGSTAVYQGTIYAPNANITMSGNSSTATQYTIVVALTMRLVGTTGFNNDYSSLPGGTPIKQVALVE